MRQFLGLFLAFAIGGMSCQIYNDRKIANLKAGMECAYHTGYSEGWQGASFKPRAKELAAPRQTAKHEITDQDARDLADILTQR